MIRIQLRSYRVIGCDDSISEDPRSSKGKDGFNRGLGPSPSLARPAASSDRTAAADADIDRIIDQNDSG